MSYFIAILICIAIELGIRPLDTWRRFDWFSQLTDWVLHQLQSSSVRDGPIAVLAILAPVVLGVWLATYILSGVWLFGFIFSVFILSMSLGPSDPIRQAQAYASALEQGDEAAVNARATDFLGRSVSDDPQVTAQTIKEQLFVRLCVNILGVFFWFIVLGPVGAAIFRASCLLQERYEGVPGGLTHAINELFNILLWIPARLTVLSFSIVGNFVDTAHSLRNYSDLWRRDSRELLSAAGLGALHIPDQGDDGQVDIEHLVHTIALVKRTVLVWITAFALIIILIGLVGISSWVSG